MSFLSVPSALARVRARRAGRCDGEVGDAFDRGLRYHQERLSLHGDSLHWKPTQRELFPGDVFGGDGDCWQDLGRAASDHHRRASACDQASPRCSGLSQAKSVR